MGKTRGDKQIGEMEEKGYQYYCTTTGRWGAKEEEK